MKAEQKREESKRRKQTAESIVSPTPDVPATPRDHVASAIRPVMIIGCLSPVAVAIVGAFMGSLFLAFVLPVVVLIVSVILAGLVERLEGPRKAARRELEEQREASVRGVADRKLREMLVRIDAEQFEYRRFYQTSDWREIRRAVMERDGEVCRLCGSRGDLTVDHILPRSLYPDRALDPENLQVICRSCNAAKGTEVEPSEGM